MIASLFQASEVHFYSLCLMSSFLLGSPHGLIPLSHFSHIVPQVAGAAVLPAFLGASQFLDLGKYLLDTDAVSCSGLGINLLCLCIDRLNPLG